MRILLPDEDQYYEMFDEDDEYYPDGILEERQVDHNFASIEYKKVEDAIQRMDQVFPDLLSVYIVLYGDFCHIVLVDASEFKYKNYGRLVSSDGRLV